MSDMDSQMNVENDSPIVELFKRVACEPEFKKLLMENPDEAIKEYERNDAQIIMVKNLSPEDIEKLTLDNLEEFFSADAAVYTPDEGEDPNAEMYSIDDFQE